MLLLFCQAPIINKVDGNNNYFEEWNIKNYQKADLEYVSFSSDVVLGFIWFILGLIQFQEPAN